MVGAGKQKIATLLGLVIVDALTKIVAFLTLPMYQAVRRDALIQVVLSLNQYGIGT